MFIKNPRTYALVGTGLILTIFVGSLLFTYFYEPTYSLKISAGSASGIRSSIAQTIGEFTKTDKVKLKIVETSGSQHALQDVNQHKLDLALVQGGLIESQYPNVQQVAVLHVEPLHLLVKPHGTTPDHLTLEDVAEWMSHKEKLKVNVSTPGSGTSALSNELIKFFDFDPNTNFELTELSYEKLLDQTMTAEEMPDAIFTVSSLPSPVARHLINEFDFRPVELPVASAFRIDWSAAEKTDSKIQKRHLSETTIPAFTYRVNPPVPSVPIRTLGARLQLVANKQVPKDAIEKVVNSIYGSPFANVTQPPLMVSLLNTDSDFQLHAGAKSYLEKKTPIITERFVEMTEQLFGITGAICGAILFFWQAIGYTRRQNRDRQFLSYIGRVSEIENRAMKYELDQDMTVDDLVNLQTELNQIKREMIKKFQQGDIDGTDTLSTFLKQVNDANENLTRTILHERKPKDLPSN